MAVQIAQQRFPGIIVYPCLAVTVANKVQSETHHHPPPYELLLCLSCYFTGRLLLLYRR